MRLTKNTFFLEGFALIRARAGPLWAHMGPKNVSKIRKEFALSVGENSVHGSDSIENAKTEISQFFSEPEIVG